jgi:hypothetical protein
MYEILKKYYKYGTAMKKNKDIEAEKFIKDRQQKYEKDKKNYTGPHCCLTMHYAVNKNNPENVSPISYNPKFRGYYLTATRGPGGRQIEYCPHCGTKLPKELSDEWFDILEEEYGLDNPISLEQQKQIPVEFQTDEWWKNRGL